MTVRRKIGSISTRKLAKPKKRKVAKKKVNYQAERGHEYARMDVEGWDVGNKAARKAHSKAVEKWQNTRPAGSKYTRKQYADFLASTAKTARRKTTAKPVKPPKDYKYEGGGRRDPFTKGGKLPKPDRAPINLKKAKAAKKKKRSR